MPFSLYFFFLSLFAFWVFVYVKKQRYFQSIDGNVDLLDDVLTGCSWGSVEICEASWKLGGSSRVGPRQP